MHKLLFVALLMCSTVAMAEEPAAAPDGGGGKPRAERGERGERPHLSIEEKKAKIFKKMEERRACVQAAATDEALSACFPHKRGGGEGGGRRGGWGHRKGGEGGGAGGGDAPGGEE